MQLDESMKNKRIQEAIAEQQSIETANFFKNEDRIMELTKKNDLVWDKAVQIMLTVESLQKNVSSAEHVARSIQKATKNDRGQSELAEIKVEFTK